MSRQICLSDDGPQSKTHRPMPIKTSKRLSTGRVLQGIEHQFVDIAPAPVFSRLKRLDDGMMAPVEMARRMLVG